MRVCKKKDPTWNIFTKCFATITYIEYLNVLAQFAKISTWKMQYSFCYFAKKYLRGPPGWLL